MFCSPIPAELGCVGTVGIMERKLEAAAATTDWVVDETAVETDGILVAGSAICGVEDDDVEVGEVVELDSAELVDGVSGSV